MPRHLSNSPVYVKTPLFKGGGDEVGRLANLAQCQKANSLGTLEAPSFPLKRQQFHR
jgi:hypothetical protein